MSCQFEHSRQLEDLEDLEDVLQSPLLLVLSNTFSRGEIVGEAGGGLLGTRTSSVMITVRFDSLLGGHSEDEQIKEEGKDRQDVYNVHGVLQKDYLLW